MAALEGRTALVTGSTSGIGRAIAEHLGGQGCNQRLVAQLNVAGEM